MFVCNFGLVIFFGNATEGSGDFGYESETHDDDEVDGHVPGEYHGDQHNLLVVAFLPGSQWLIEDKSCLPKPCSLQQNQIAPGHRDDDAVFIPHLQGTHDHTGVDDVD